MWCAGLIAWQCTHIPNESGRHSLGLRSHCTQWFALAHTRTLVVFIILISFHLQHADEDGVLAIFFPASRKVGIADVRGILESMAGESVRAAIIVVQAGMTPSAKKALHEAQAEVGSVPPPQPYYTLLHTHTHTHTYTHAHT
jgi:hypothetical protein